MQECLHESNSEEASGDNKLTGTAEAPIMAYVSNENGLAVKDACPSFKDTAKWHNWDTEEPSEPNFDIAAPELDQRYLPDAMEATIGKEQAQEQQKRILDWAKESINSVLKW